MIKSSENVRDYLRVGQCAEILGVSNSTVRRMVSDGILDCWRSQEGATGHRFISMKSVKAFLGEEPENGNRLTIGYARVSTTGIRQQSSLENQIEQLNEARGKIWCG